MIITLLSIVNTEHVIFTLYANKTQTRNFPNISSKNSVKLHIVARRNNTSFCIKWEYLLQHKPNP